MVEPLSHPVHYDGSPKDLLLRILAELERYRLMPLHCQIDSLGIVHETMKLGEQANAAAAACIFRPPAGIVVQLNEVVATVLSSQEHDPNPSKPIGFTAPIELDPARMFANWLDQFYVRIRQIDPRALDVVRFRLHGDTPRQISEQLDLGLRLVNRLLIEMRLAWEGGVQA